MALLSVLLLVAGTVAAKGNAAPQTQTRNSAGKAPGIGFQLRKTKLSPKRPYFEGLRPIRLDYGFAARRATDLRIRIISVRSGNTVRVYRERDARPGERLQRRWNGLDRRGKAVGDGRYEFRVGPKGGRDLYAGRLRLHGHVFPIDGAHADRGAIGEFGAGRNGGRTHQGFDVNANCGTGLIAARAGK